MSDDRQIREAFCEIGRRVWQKNFIASNDGNFSYRLDENRVLCTPTMTSKGFMKPEDMVIVDLEGNQLSDQRKLTSEIRVHLFIYRQRPDLRSVVHVHPPHATAFAIVGRDLPKCVLPEVEVNLGEVPMAPYVLSGTWKFAESLAPWVRTHDAFLLRNHGAITTGVDPFDAYYKMETLDQYCRILLLAMQAGNIQRLTEGDIQEILDMKARIGIREPRESAATACSPGVPPRSDAAIRPPQQFVPAPIAATDEPKFARKPEPTPTSTAPAGTAPTGDTEAIVRQVADEIMRRLGRGEG